MRLIGLLSAVAILIVGSAVAAPNVVMQDVVAMAQGGDITQTALNDGSSAGDDAILYQSISQSAVGEGDVSQTANNQGNADGANTNANQGIIQSAQGYNVDQSGFNLLTSYGNQATIGQSITQGANAEVDAVQSGINVADIDGGNVWLGQLVQSGAAGEFINQYARNLASVNDFEALGDNSLGQSIILGATATSDVSQDGLNFAELVGGDGNLAQLSEAGATGDTIYQMLQNMAEVSKADTFVVGQNNVAGGETDQSSSTAVEQHQYNIVSWDPNSDGMLNQHIEGGAFADTVIQDQVNDQQ